MYTEAQDRDAYWAREVNTRDDEDWRQTMAILADRWPVLTIEELLATRGRPEMVASLFEAKIGYAQLLARDALAPWQKQRASSAYGSPWLLQSAGVVSALGAVVLGAGIVILM